MNRFKKAISVGMSATLLASLFTVIAASSALAAVTVTSAGNVPVDGTSAGSATFLFVESSATGIPTNAAGGFTVVIAPAAPGLGAVTFSGTPVVSAPGSLGASASITGSTLSVSWTNSDTAQIESISVSGLFIAAAAGTSTGAITATMGGATGNGSVAAFQAGGTASGTLSAGISIGATSAIVNVATSGCLFISSTGTPGQLAFAQNPESRDITAAVAGPGVGQQTLTIAATANVHDAATAVSQADACVASGVLASPGTVVAALTYNNPTPKLSVFPGENNSPATSIVLVEPSAGFLPAASTFTYTIATAGVVFSTAPTVSGSNAFATNEVQTITLAGAGLLDGFNLTFNGQTTTPNSDATTTTGLQVQTALEALSNIAVGDVAVTGAAGGPYTVTFMGAYAGLNVVAITGTGFDGPDAGAVAPTVTVATTTAGATGVGAMVLSAAVLSGDRKSATVTVTTASTLAGATITLSNILYDVAATVPGGTFISVGVATSGGLAVLPPTRTNAVVFRGIVAVSATSPTVYIGENNQAAGIVSFTEAAAGFFTDGTGSNNTFTICPNGVTFVFTLAPSAKVTGGVAAGNLILREGAVASPDNIVPGTLTNLPRAGCYTWTVWTKSTTASTIQIGNVDVTTGALINVNVNQAPGAVLVDLYIGSSALASQLAATVQFAVAAFRNQVVVTALSQPTIPVGSNGSPAGNIQIDETATGQLKAGEEICVEVLPNQNAGTLYDAFLKGLTTADVPVVTATNGVVTGPVTFSNQNCEDTLGANPGTLAHSFAFFIVQQSTGGNGRLVISNIKYATVNDAVTGPVQVNVYGFGGVPTHVVFQALISNARIGVGVGGTNATRLGVTQTGAFTISTKVASVRRYVTYRFDFGVAAAGQIFVISGATKTGNDWSAFTVVTSRRANASGVVYYYIRQNSATWKSYRASWAGGGVITLARQARWR